MTRIAVVLGTYNRLPLLKEAIASIDRASKFFPTAIVVDGGSTDGTQAWLREQPNVRWFQGGLHGAVEAFNQGFGYAVDQGFEFVANFNDDAIYETPGMLDSAVGLMQYDGRVGQVAFAFDLWGPYHFDHINGVPYANYGLTRMHAGQDVARAQGDPYGKKWWDPCYHTYAADTQFGAWMWKLGWRVHCDENLKVHDLRADDELRKLNSGEKREQDSELFWSRWRNENLSQYL